MRSTRPVYTATQPIHPIQDFVSNFLPFPLIKRVNSSGTAEHFHGIGRRLATYSRHSRCLNLWGELKTFKLLLYIAHGCAHLLKLIC